MSKGTVKVNLTIGFGNNLFQYCFARLLSEKYNLNLNHREIKEFSIPESNNQIDNRLNTIIINDNNYIQALQHDLSSYNIVVNGYFEDYRIYKNHLNRIRTWFPATQITNKNDLILHLRLQNRLVQVSHHKNHVLADGYKKGIEKFDYENLHIITDAKKWSHYSKEDIEEIRHEIMVGPNPPSNSPWVDVNQSLDYMNNLIDGFSDLNPIVHCNNEPVIEGSGGLRSGHMKDFDFIRSFDKVMIFNSTFSWWAAVLSGASSVGTWEPWKPNKGAKNKNLGRTDYNGWFSWGSTEDLYWEQS